MSEHEMKVKVRGLRREADKLRTAVALLLAAAVLVSVALCGAVRHWKEKYRVAVQIEQDAIAAYGELKAQVEAERTARAEAEAAYAELEGYEYMGTFNISHYCCENYDHICNDGDSITASGLQVQPGVVAVDPDVIPLGSTVIINGTSYLAADTGVTGSWIDIAVPTHSEALDLGVYTASVWILVTED